MQVHYDEGIANHIGPEPCAGIREDVGEASAGERAGQPLSRDRKLIPGADAVCVAEGHMYVQERQRKRLGDPAWSKNLARTHAPCTGTGRIAGSATGPEGWMVRGGKVRSRIRNTTTARSFTS